MFAKRALCASPPSEIKHIQARNRNFHPSNDTRLQVQLYYNLTKHNVSEIISDLLSYLGSLGYLLSIYVDIMVPGIDPN